MPPPPPPPSARPTICEPVCKVKVTGPPPPFRARPAPDWISPALTTVVAPLSVRTAGPWSLMICPPARFSIVATNELPTVFENTPSEPTPVARIVPLLMRVSLLPCMKTAVLPAPLVVSEPMLVIVPFPPRIETARAVDPLVVTVPLLVKLLLVCPTLVWPQAAVMP